MFESMVDTDKTGVLCPVALHLAEGSTQTVSNPEAEMAGGAKVPLPPFHHTVFPTTPVPLIYSDSSSRHNLKQNYL